MTGLLLSVSSEMQTKTPFCQVRTLEAHNACVLAGHTLKQHLFTFLESQCCCPSTLPLSCGEVCTGTVGLKPSLSLLPGSAAWFFASTETRLSACGVVSHEELPVNGELCVRVQHTAVLIINIVLIYIPSPPNASALSVY